PKKELPNYPNKNNDIEIVGKCSYSEYASCSEGESSEDDYGQELRAGDYIELLEKVKPGRKPSDIKRLKRSKSDSDLAPIPVAPPNLLQDQLTQKQKELEELRAKLEIAHQALKEIKQLLDNSLEARTNALSD
ncbi:15587_t:CDS:2, partial [Funneliformis geosporum]